MPKIKQEKIMLDDYEYLGMEKGKFIIRDKERNIKEEHAVFESNIGEVILKSGCCVSVGVLSCLSFWEIDTLILTRKGKPVGYLRSTEYDSHAKTRIDQYKAYLGEKGIHIAKQIIQSKLEGQNLLLQKYNLKLHNSFTEKINSIQNNNLRTARSKLTGIEGKYTREYYNKIFQLLPLKIRSETRKTLHAYDGTNNILSLLYTFLKWKCQIALIRAKLEPYLGFLHSLQFGKPSLVLDFMELYRSTVVDNFFIEYSQNLRKKDFITKFESITKKRKGKREYLNNTKTNELMRNFYEYLETKIDLPRIRTKGKQTVETLINEEAYLLAKYLRNERNIWKPRIMIP